MHCWNWSNQPQHTVLPKSIMYLQASTNTRRSQLRNPRSHEGYQQLSSFKCPCPLPTSKYKFDEKTPTTFVHYILQAYNKRPTIIRKTEISNTNTAIRRREENKPSTSKDIEPRKVSLLLYKSWKCETPKNSSLV